MFKPNVSILAFDDRKLFFIGVPVIALAIPFLFFSVQFSYYIKVAHIEYTESLVYTLVYWLFTRYLIIEARKRFPKYEKLWLRFSVILVLILVSVPAISFGVTGIIDFIKGKFGIADYICPTLLQGLSSTYVISITMLILYEAIYFFHKYNEATVEKEQIRQAHIQAQLDNLRNQINPHFLFNSLNTLMNLIPKDSERAMNYLCKLSKFYRYTVSNREKELVLLSTEIENVALFVDLLKERYHNAIKVSLPEEINSNAKILPLCLQLLIENAVKHNIVSHKMPLKIELKQTEDENRIEILNNIQKKIQEVSSTGMGLKNIKRRIAYYTDDDLRITESDHFFVVSVPLIYDKNK